MRHLDCERLLADYSSWLRAGLTAVVVDAGCRIATPFLDRHNNLLEIYVEPLSGENVLLSDDGHIMRDLQISGFELGGERRQDALDTILRSFGIQLRGDELVVEASPRDFAQKKHNLIQTMLAAGDLVLLAQPTVMAVFVEDVATYLEANQVRFTPNLKLTGGSGLDQSFDFVIPKSNGAPERILKAIATPTRPNIIELMFAWQDVRAARPENALAYAILNDTARAVSQDHINALHAYDIQPVLWTERESRVGELKG